MKRVSVTNLLKLATKFERLAQMDPASVVSSRSVRFLYSNLKSLLNKEISFENFSNWYKNNINLLGKFSALNHTWYENYAHELELDISDPSKNPPATFPKTLTALIINAPRLNRNWGDDEYSKREILEESVLHGLGDIPTLKLFIIESISLVNGGQLPKEIAHEEFLILALKELYGHATTAQIIEFYNQNKSKINKIRSLFKGKPEKLGSGADGIAFALGPKLVLKIFSDAFSYNKAVEAAERLHKYPELSKTEAMIYDIGKLGSFKNNPVYYYIMERMKTARSLNDRTINALTLIAKEIAINVRDLRAQGGLSQIKANIADPAKHKDIKVEVRRLARGIADQIGSRYSNEIDTVETGSFKTQLAYNDPRRAMGPPPNGESLKLNPNWLTLFAEEILMKYLTSRTDIHMGNLGVTRYGEFRYFDPAYADWVSELNL